MGGTCTFVKSVLQCTWVSLLADTRTSECFHFANSLFVDFLAQHTVVGSGEMQARGPALDAKYPQKKQGRVVHL